MTEPNLEAKRAEIADKLAALRVDPGVAELVREANDAIQNFKGEAALSAVPLETRRTTGAKLWIPVDLALAEVLEARERRGECILETALGRPFTSNGFGNYMADKIARAGPPDRSGTHGSRKAAARRLDEARCTANALGACRGAQGL